MPIKKWLIESLTVVRLKELNARQQSTGSSSDCHCCSRGACKTSWNLIVAGKPVPQALPSSCVSVPLMYALSSFSSITSWQNTPHNSSNSTWRWSDTREMDHRVPHSSPSQRTQCRQRSAGSSGHTSWADFSEFFEVTRIQVHIEECERKSKGVEEQISQLWVASG